MALRRAKAVIARSNSSDPATTSDPAKSLDPVAERSRRVLTAFVVGAAISAAGLAVLAANGAAAHGPFTAANPTTFQAAPQAAAAYQPTYSVAHFEARGYADGPRRRHGRERITVVGGGGEVRGHIGYAGNQPVCVRLCDGFFFPLTAAAGDPATQTAACNSLCPDAPTEVYYRNGSDRIEDAISANGRPYTALPVSLRYRGTSDNTCACHRDVVAYAPLRDATLRRGDALMTPAGFVVFHGAEGAKHSPGDFAALASARLSRTQRGVLQALERVSLDKDHPTLKDWLASQTPPALALRRSPHVAPRAPRVASGDDKIRLIVLRGDAED